MVLEFGGLASFVFERNRNIFPIALGDGRLPIP